MPAPDVEQLVLDGVRTHLRSLEVSIDGVDRDLIERHVDRVIIGPQAVEIRLTPSEAKEPPELHRDELDARAPTSTPLMLPWEAPASVAVKGIVHTLTAAPPMAPEPRDALLATIAKARGWIEELRLSRLATLAEIAECEGLGERHVGVLAARNLRQPRRLQLGRPQHLGASKAPPIGRAVKMVEGISAVSRRAAKRCIVESASNLDGCRTRRGQGAV